MRKVTTQLFCVTALAFLALALGAQPALGSDADVTTPPASFGLLFGAPISSTLTGSGWTASYTEQVFNNAGVYTYMFTLTNSGTSALPLSELSASSLGFPNFNGFDPGLNWGLVTDPAFTTAGVDDGVAGCPGPNDTFCFNTSSWTMNPASSGSNELKPGDKITIYGQGGAPVPGMFGAKDGSTLVTGTAMTPGPEPSSMLLFGSGLLMLGVFLRRRLPQVPQPF
jgi:hypothetical protein